MIARSLIVRQGRLIAEAAAARRADTLTPAQRGWETRRMNAEDERRAKAGNEACLAASAIIDAIAAGFDRAAATRLADHHRRAEWRALVAARAA